MAIALTQGHVQRAIDLYNKRGNTFFIIGGTEPWGENEDEENFIVPTPSIDEYKLNGILGLKKVDKCSLIIPFTGNIEDLSTEEKDRIIPYKNQNWEVTTPPYSTITTSAITVNGDTSKFSVESIGAMRVGSKLRIGSAYECKIVDIVGNSVTVDAKIDTQIPTGSTVEGGALVEGAKYLYLSCILDYEKFPLGDNKGYRQVGLCTGVTPTDSPGGILRPGEYTSLGVLEVLDNRAKSTRSSDKYEEISLILEF